MNYRHGFHAGNFADLAKHAAMLTLLRLLRNNEKPVPVIMTCPIRILPARRKPRPASNT